MESSQLSKSPRVRPPTTSLQSPRPVWTIGDVKTSSLMDWNPGRLRGNDTRTFYGMVNPVTTKSLAAPPPPLLRRRVTECTKGEQALVTAICNNRRQNPKSLPPNLSPTDAWCIAKGQKLAEKLPAKTQQTSKGTCSTEDDDSTSEVWSVCGSCKQTYAPRNLRDLSSLTAMVRLRRSANIPFVPSCRKTTLYVHRLTQGMVPEQTTPRLPGATKPEPTTLNVDVYLPKLGVDCDDGTTPDLVVH